MGATGDGVITEDYVAFVEVAGEGFDLVPHCEGHATQVDRQVWSVGY